jgi:hypothetical protein
MALRGRPPKHEKIVRECLVCGKAWANYGYESRTKYCSRACWATSRKGKVWGPYVARIEKSCDRCGESFVTGGYGNRPRRSRFCGVRCANLWRIRGNPGHAPVRQMTPEEAAWMGGLFDGEGCVVWPRRTNLRSVRLSVTNTSLALLERIKSVTGTGTIYDRTKSRTSNRHSPIWAWHSYAEFSPDILRQILPWLIVKREAAEVVLGLREATEPPRPQRTLTMMAAAEMEMRA